MGEQHSIRIPKWQHTGPRAERLIMWLNHICSGSKEKFSSTRQLPMHGYLFFRRRGVGWWRVEGVLSHYMYLSVRVSPRSCHLTWQVYQCPQLIRTHPSDWQAEPTVPQSRLTAPQVAAGGWGVKEHSQTRQGEQDKVCEHPEIRAPPPSANE